MRNLFLKASARMSFGHLWVLVAASMICAFSTLVLIPHRWWAIVPGVLCALDAVLFAATLIVKIRGRRPRETPLA